MSTKQLPKEEADITLDKLNSRLKDKIDLLNIKMDFLNSEITQYDLKGSDLKLKLLSETIGNMQIEINDIKLTTLQIVETKFAELNEIKDIRLEIEDIKTSIFNMISHSQSTQKNYNTALNSDQTESKTQPVYTKEEIVQEVIKRILEV